MLLVPDGEIRHSKISQCAPHFCHTEKFEKRRGTRVETTGAHREQKEEHNKSTHTHTHVGHRKGTVGTGLRTGKPCGHSGGAQGPQSKTRNTTPQTVTQPWWGQLAPPTSTPPGPRGQGRQGQAITHRTRPGRGGTQAGEARPQGLLLRTSSLSAPGGHGGLDSRACHTHPVRLATVLRC